MSELSVPKMPPHITDTSTGNGTDSHVTEPKNVPQDPSPKIQPWKAMKSLEENTNPDFSKMKELSTKPTSSTMGASVSKPMDRRTEYEGLNA